MATVSLQVSDTEVEGLLKQLGELALNVSNVKVLDKAVEAAERKRETFMGITEYVTR